jgi:HEAT repeat protein
VANALETLAQFVTDAETGFFFDFLINQKALGDQNAEVRGAMLQAGIAAIDSVGGSQVDILMHRFEEHLVVGDASTAASDYIQESVIVLFGRLAGHLDLGDHRRPTVVERLVQALSIPSETVQVAVASCLSPLAATVPHPELLVDRLLHSLTDSPRYAERRGTAYGLAGMVHGLGISSLKTFGILRYLKSALDNKKQFEYRQGAVFAFETLSSTLGRLFEPYITEILPLLLVAFGDSTPDVREATTDASKSIMATVSAYGVKLILPELLEALEEKQWRTKKGAIELMGSMAFCSPKQLSISLPAIIPRLTGVLTDSHAQVRTAANKSLKQFGEVINNPEIQAMVPVLLKALVDPDKIAAGLTSLLRASFMHYIDSPSLALVSLTPLFKVCLNINR